MKDPIESVKEKIREFKAKRVPTSKKELRIRGWLMVIAVGFMFLIVAGNLGRIMIINGDFYKTKAEKNQLQDKEITATRGTIYDANGMVVAQSVSAWRIYATPKTIKAKDPNEVRKVREFVCRTMSEAMPDITYEEFEKIFSDSTSSYSVIRKRGSEEEKAAVAAVLNNFILYKPGVDEKQQPSDEETKFYIRDVVGIDPDTKRVYPYGSLASNVIGLTNADNRGSLGVELSYDDLLAGMSGRLISAKNGRNQTMGEEFEMMYDAVQGTGIGLTIDMNIQRLVEEQLWDVYEDSEGIGAYGIVMNVNTGAILAMANVPGFDANDPYALTEDQTAEIELMKADDFDNEEAFNAAVAQAKSNLRNRNWRNFTVSDSYEPGSVFKTIITSAGLESGKLTMGTDWNCIGYARVTDDTIINCNKAEGHGEQTLREGLKNSCNPFFIHCGQLIGSETFFNFFEAFGFTEKTGVDLPAETTPKAGVAYHPLEDLHTVELASSAFGQSFQVTPLQMITAISAIANGGNLMKPYVVAKTFDEYGNVLSVTQPEIRRQVISKETAALVADMMEDVVSSGTGKNAYVAGYRVAGKTGTSQKLTKEDQHKYYLASFACFAPADDPEIAVLIVVDEPKGQINGGQICTPIAAKIVEGTLEYMNVERQYTDKELAKLAVATPEVLGENTDRAKETLSDAGFTVRVVGDGDYVTDQMPSAGSTIPQNGVVVIYSDNDSDKLMATVPDLGGLSISQATSKATSEGLNITISGNSSIESSELVSYDQSIAEGENVEYGTTITVYFKSNSGVSDYSE